jgi:hypothetical protein
MNQTEFTITRKGTIRLDKSKASNSQCITQGHEEYHFECAVAFVDPILDRKGFIIDHNTLNEWFIEAMESFGVIPSCEIYGRDLLVFLSRKLRAKGLKAKTIEIKVGGNPSFYPAFIAVRHSILT